MFRSLVGTLVAASLVFAPLVRTAASSSETKFSLTIENIMRGPALVGTEPSQIRWSGDSSKIYFQWKKPSDPENAPLDTYVVNRDGSDLRKLTDEEARLAPPFVAETNKDRTLSVFAQDGDIVVLDNSTNKRRQVTKTADAETNPRFMPDGHRITFQRGGNLFLMSLENGDLEQLTDIHAAPAAGTTPTPATGSGQGQGRGGQGRGGQAAPRDAADGPPKGTESQEYLKKEQADFFETVRDREKLQKENEEKRKKLNPRKPYNLQARQTLTALQLSPDGKYVFGVLGETATGTKPSNVPSWITDSSFPEDIPSRPRVGDDLQQRHLLIINVITGEAKRVEHEQVKTPVAEIVDGGACGGRAGFGGGGFGGQQTVSFSEDGAKAVFTARAQDNKSCWIFGLDPVTAKARVMTTQEDKAWLGGPGGGEGWLPDNENYFFTSEKDGFNHLYTVPFAGGAPKQLTSGKYEVTRVDLSHDKSRFYLLTSEGDLAEQNFWSMPIAGGEPVRITKATGVHAATLSPDESWIADVYSYVNKPPEIYVQPNQPGAEAKQLTVSPAPEFANYKWLDTPLTHIPARDGAQIPAQIYKPANFRKGGPAVIFVHGAGYTQNVTKGWSSSYYHEYLFNQFLMQHGYLVATVDYRGSKGYGRDWRTGIYRHMGGKDLDDNTDAAKWLVTTYGVDPKRIGLYGGSYGGFITLMALFTQSDVFAAGAALRPVSDWALYNQGYTGNILNQPQGDAEAYKQSSPIFFADGLKGALLICHGMVDTNVHFVDTVRLVERLIELHKDNWDLAVYPVEDHGFKEAASWTDEYKRIFKLFEANLKKAS